MKWKPILTAITLSSMLLAACGTNDTAMNDRNARNGNDNLTNVNYRNNTYQDDLRTNDRGLLNIGGNQSWDGQRIQGDRTNGNNNLANRADQMNISDQNYQANYIEPQNNGIQNGNNNNRMRVADEAAKKIADLKEVDRANVIVTDNNAYVAVNTENNSSERVAKDIEEKISRIVKSTDRDIDNVYVSQDPDFFNRMTTYSNDIRNGRPIEGFFDEFGNTVRRIFPTER
jgi:spore cortex protein